MFPHSFQRFAGLAVSLMLCLLAGCSSTPPRGKPSKSSFSTASQPSVLTPEQAQDTTMHALGLVGTPYRYGGNTPDSGFDCSGLIGYVYQKTAGLTPPRTVARLQSWGQSIDPAQLQTGDLVVFAIGGAPSHAGIYVGGGRFVHAPSSGGQVRMDSLQSKYWQSKSMAVRRP